MGVQNRIRYYHYISGVFANQQLDPLCCKCKAFANSVRIVKDDIVEFERTQESNICCLPQELQRIFYDAKKTISILNPPMNAVGQKKAGNCKMPEGICFVKLSKAIIEKI
ncbi:hypothetical protein A45J_1391 [hot springs metagenome]|uniref:Uncharacterized protein n=1 Tax=hot springs metagenome TaxID=433727 RepID=A0A5J4L4B8_9ZZZZ